MRSARALRSIFFAASMAALPAAIALDEGAAFAQPTDDDIAKAKARFDAGLKAEDAGDWASALAAFQDVAKVKLTAQVRFKIAFSEEHLGHVLAAKHGYEEALELAKKDPEKAQDVISEAPKRIEILTPRVPHITLSVVMPTERKVEATVFLDGTAVDATTYGKPIEAEVGDHEVEVEVAHHTPAREKIDAFALHDSEAKKVHIDLDEFKPETGPIDKGPKMVPVEVPGTKIPAIIAGSVGIASLVVSGVFLGLRQHAIDEVLANCTDPDHNKGCNPKVASIADDGLTYTYVSASMAAVGVVGLGVGAVLWFTVGGKHTEAQPAEGPIQSIQIGPGFVGVQGRF